jgi:hypothetical protein
MVLTSMHGQYVYAAALTYKAMMETRQPGTLSKEEQVRPRHLSLCTFVVHFVCSACRQETYRQALRYAERVLHNATDAQWRERFARKVALDLCALLNDEQTFYRLRDTYIPAPSSA